MNYTLNNLIDTKIYRSIVKIYFITVILFGIVFSITSSTYLDSKYTAVIQNLWGIIWILAILVIIIKISIEQLHEPNLYHIILTIIICITGYMSFGNSSLEWLDIAAFLICGARNVDLKKLVKYLFIAELISNLLIIILAALGVIGNITMIKGGHDVVSYAFGFVHPNTLAIRVFEMVMMYIYLKDSSLNILDFIIIAALSVAVKIVTDCDTYLLVIILVEFLLLCYYVYIKYKKDTANRIIKSGFSLLKWIPVMTTLLMTVVTVLLGNSSWYLNLFKGNVGYRIRQTFIYFQYYGFSIFGKRIETNIDPAISTKYGDLAILDNAYMFLLLQFGVIAFILFITASVIYAFKVAGMGKYLLLVILVAYALYGCLENAYIMPINNFTILLYSELLWNEKFVNYKKYDIKKAIKQL